MQTRSGKITQAAFGKSRLFVCCALFLGAAAFGFAQDVQISFAEGGEFALSSGGKRVVYQSGSLNTGGLSMRPEDILQTGQGGFVELRLEPGGPRIKVAENTSLVYNDAGSGTGSASFTLLYGRIRLSTAGIPGAAAGGENSVRVKTGQAEAVFYRGDAGVDFIANARETYFDKGEPVLRVYCFDGLSELVPLLAAPPGGAAPKFAVNAYESLSIGVMNPLSYIERRPLDEDIAGYWNRHNFSGGMPPVSARPAARAETAAPAAVEVSPAPREQAPRVIEKIQYVPEDNSRNKKLSRVKNIFLITGLALTIGGVGMQGAGIFQPGGMQEQDRNLLINYGYLPLGLGILLGGAAFAVNPAYTGNNAAD